MLAAVVIVYLAGTLIVGVLLSSRIKRVSDYLVAGRNLGLVLTTASLAAVQIGAGVVLGGAEVAATSGVWPVDPGMDPLRGEPGFAAILDQVGLSDA